MKISEAEAVKMDSNGEYQIRKGTEEYAKLSGSNKARVNAYQRVRTASGSYASKEVLSKLYVIDRKIVTDEATIKRINYYNKTTAKKYGIGQIKKGQDLAKMPSTKNAILKDDYEARTDFAHVSDFINIVEAEEENGGTFQFQGLEGDEAKEALNEALQELDGKSYIIEYSFGKGFLTIDKIGIYFTSLSETKIEWFDENLNLIDTTEIKSKTDE